MARRSPSIAARVRGLLLTGALLPASGCVTAAMWEELPDRDRGHIDWCEGSTVGAVALTPVTVAVDAALIVGFLWLIAEDDGCGCEGDAFTFEFD